MRPSEEMEMPEYIQYSRVNNYIDICPIQAMIALGQDLTNIHILYKYD